METYTCENCGLSLKTEKNYKKHITDCKPLECRKCKRVFKRKQNLKKHLENGCHEFTCKICHKTFSNNNNFKTHKCEIKVDEPVNNKCGNCHKIFVKLAYLKRHIEKNICKKNKSIETNQQEEMQNHQEEIHKLQELLKFYKLHYETSLEQNKLMVMREMKAYEMYFVNKKLNKTNLYEIFSVINYFHNEKNYTVLAKILSKIQAIDNADIALEEILLLRLMKGTIGEHDDFRIAYPYLLKMIKDDKRKKNVMEIYKKYNTIEPIKALL